MRNRSTILCFILIALVFSTDASAESAYRKALRAYWKDVMKEEGVIPLFYGSSLHEPKTLWIQKNKVMDFASSGRDILPDALVPILTMPIALPQTSVERTKEIGGSLHLAGVRDIADVNLDLLAKSETSWSIETSDPVMLLVAKQDARACMTKHTSDAKAEHLAGLTSGEHLFVIVKAIRIGETRVNVRAKTGSSIALSADVQAVLDSVGFKFSSDKTVATKVTANNLIFAVGFRELTDAGLKGATDNAPIMDAEIEVPSQPVIRD